MTSVADAYVDLHVNGDHLEGEVRHSVKESGKPADKEADKIGKSLGSKMSAGFTKGFGKNMKSGSMFKDLRTSAEKAVFDVRKTMMHLGDGTLLSRFRTNIGDGRADFVRHFRFMQSTARTVFSTLKSGADKAGNAISTRFKSMSASAKKVGADLKKGLGGGLKGLMLPAIAALVPFVTSSLSALTGAATALVGAMAQAGGASLAFGGILGGLLQGMLVGKMAFGGIGKAVTGTAEDMKKLTPAAQGVAKAFKSLGPEWKKVKDAVQSTAFKGLEAPIKRLGTTMIPMLRTQFKGMGTEINFLVKDVLRFANSANGVNKFKTAISGNTAVFGTLRQAAVPLLKGILNLYNALLPSAGRLAAKIVEGAKSFRAWSAAPGFMGRIDDFMKRAFKSAGNLWGILKNLGKVLHNVFGAATPAGDGLLATLNKLTAKFAAFTAKASSKSAIAEWAQKGIDVSGQLFSALGRIGKALLPLFNPKIAGGFLTMFEKAMPIISSVVGVIQGALEPVIKSIGDALAENGPKFAALFKALGPLLKGIGAVIGQVVVQAVGLLGTVAAVITPVVRVISKVLGPILTKFAPIIAAIILLFGGFAAKLVGLIPVVGRFLAPLIKLSSWLLNKIAPAFGILAKIVGSAFKLIGATIGGVVRVVGPLVARVFGGIARIIGGGMRAAAGVVRTAWNIIRGAFTIVLRVISVAVRTYFNIYKRIITTVLNVIKAVVSRVWNGIRGVVVSVLSRIRGAVSTAFNAVKGITSRIWGGLKSVVSKAMSGVMNTVRSGLGRVVSFVKGIPRKILNLAGSFLNAGKDLGKKVMSGLGKGLKSAAGFVGNIGTAVKHAINSALHLPVHIKGPGPLPDFNIPAFARGTISAPGGLARINERGGELVDLPRGSKVHTANATRNLMKPDNRETLPRKVILSIGGREFVAFVNEIADGRITAADSLARRAG